MDVVGVAERVAEAFFELLEERKWKCPIYAVAVGANGSMIGCRYDFVEGEEGLSSEVLAEWYHPSQAFTLPVNIMFTDSRGEAIRVLIKGPGESLEFLN